MEGKTEEKQEEEKCVRPPVDEGKVQELVDMGFGVHRATRALYLGQCNGIEDAVQWMLEHENDEDVDQPLLLPEGQVKEKLSEEEARKKAEQMVRQARLKREEEEKKNEAERERMRIKMGKEILAAQRLEEEAARKRLLEERQREKREEEAAREKVRKQIEETRKEWRIKRGLPPEETEEEKAARREAEEKKRQEEEAKRKQLGQSKPFIKPVSKIEKLRTMLVESKKTLGEDQFKSFCKTVFTYCGNIIKHPAEEKYRKIKLLNAAFQQRVASVPCGFQLLELLGFEKDSSGEYLILEEKNVDAPLLHSAGEELHSALNNPFFGVL